MGIAAGENRGGCRLKPVPQGAVAGAITILKSGDEQPAAVPVGQPLGQGKRDRFVHLAAALGESRFVIGHGKPEKAGKEDDEAENHGEACDAAAR